MPFTTHKRIATSGLLLALGALLATACSGGSAPEATIAPAGNAVARACGGPGSTDNLVFTPSKSDYFPLVVSSDLAVGHERFVVGLLDQEQAPVKDAQLHFRFFCFADDGQRLYKAESDATALTITKTYTHTHPDGTVESHEAGELGAYVAYVDFDSPGKWGVDVSGSVGSTKLDAQTVFFQVRERSESPSVGDPAPPSVQTLLQDVGGDISQIDTSDPPDPAMHQMTIAAALQSGRPTVVVFATPAFCVSQLCGPTKGLVDDLYARYKGLANFIHIEPYFLKEAREGKGLCPVPIMNLDYAANPQPGCPQIPASELPPREQTWNLSTEPWVFIIDAKGRIAAKFEGIVSGPELEEALKPLLGS